MDLLRHEGIPSLVLEKLIINQAYSTRIRGSHCVSERWIAAYAVPFYGFVYQDNVRRTVARVLVCGMNRKGIKPFDITGLYRYRALR